MKKYAVLSMSKYGTGSVKFSSNDRNDAITWRDIMNRNRAEYEDRYVLAEVSDDDLAVMDMKADAAAKAEAAVKSSLV